jgi:protein-S-isoprenylcysteine O-methyltransferase Ste14
MSILYYRRLSTAGQWENAGRLFFCFILLYSACLPVGRALERRAEMGHEKKRLWHRWQRRITWRTLAVYAAFGVLVWFSHPSIVSFVAGTVIIGIGESIRLWAAGHLQKNAQVTTTGPYAHVKNPLYLGSLLIMAGFGVMTQVYWLLVVGVVVFVIYYAPYKKRRESDRLRERFGRTWTEYDQAVPDYLPRLRPYAHRGAARWRWFFVADNSEDGMAVGILVAVVLVGVRWWALAP